jgi:hypothetical protein
MDRRGRNQSLKISAGWNNCPENSLLSKSEECQLQLSFSQKVGIMCLDDDPQGQWVE